MGTYLELSHDDEEEHGEEEEDAQEEEHKGGDPQMTTTLVYVDFINLENKHDDEDSDFSMYGNDDTYASYVIKNGTVEYSSGLSLLQINKV